MAGVSRRGVLKIVSTLFGRSQKDSGLYQAAAANSILQVQVCTPID